MRRALKAAPRLKRMAYKTGCGMVMLGLLAAVGLFIAGFVVLFANRCFLLASPSTDCPTGSIDPAGAALGWKLIFGGLASLLVLLVGGIIMQTLTEKENQRVSEATQEPAPIDVEKQQVQEAISRYMAEFDPQDMDRAIIPEGERGEGGYAGVLESTRRQAGPGYRAIGLILLVFQYSYILQKNIDEYNYLVEKIQDDSSYAQRILHPLAVHRHELFLTESVRLLHNVVLAIKTRVDLLRVFTNKYFADDADFMEDYKARVKEMFDTDPVKFLLELRNHMTHHLLPFSEGRAVAAPGERIRFYLTLDAPALLDWDWTSRVRKWIEPQARIMIVGVVNDYGLRAKRFDEWLEQRIRIKYRNELSEYKEAMETHDREFLRVFGNRRETKPKAEGL